MYCILLFIIASIHSKSSEDLTPISNISPASGYSSLTQSLGEKKCFNPVQFAPISGFTTSIVYDYYLSFNDFHFLRQNSDGSWSHKVGYLNRLDKFDTLPNIVNGNYELIKVLEIVKPKVR